MRDLNTLIGRPRLVVLECAISYSTTLLLASVTGWMNRFPVKSVTSFGIKNTGSTVKYASIPPEKPVARLK
jgi:hypothetical protein